LLKNAYNQTGNRKQHTHRVEQPYLYGKYVTDCMNYWSKDQLCTATGAMQLIDGQHSGYTALPILMHSRIRVAYPRAFKEKLIETVSTEYPRFCGKVKETKRDGFFLRVFCKPEEVIIYWQKF